MTSTRLCYITIKTKFLSEGKPKQKRSDGFAWDCCPLKRAYPLGMFLRCPNTVRKFFYYLGPPAPLKSICWLCCAGPWMLWEKTWASREHDCLLQPLLDNVPWAGVSRTGPQRQTRSIQGLRRAFRVFRCHCRRYLWRGDAVLCSSTPLTEERDISSHLPGTVSRLVTSPAWVLISAASQSVVKGLLGGSPASLQQVQGHECRFKFLPICLSSRSLLCSSQLTCSASLFFLKTRGSKECFPLQTWIPWV